MKLCVFLGGGGRLLLVESVVVGWFEFLEKKFYWFMKLIYRMIHHDTVYQVSKNKLTDIIRSKQFKIKKCKKIETGPYIVQLKMKVPSKLSVSRVYLYEIIKA